MNNRLLSLLGIARRCGKITAGFDAVCKAMKEEAAALILLSSDISPRSEKNILFEVQKVKEQHHRELRVIKASEKMRDLGHAMGYAPVAILSVDDKGFADKIVQLLTETAEKGYPTVYDSPLSGMEELHD